MHNPLPFLTMSKITLLDGVEWDIAELETKMIDDGFYYGYCGTATLSSSAAKDLVDSPRTYHNYIKYGSTETPAMLKGRMLHHMVLEPERCDDIYMVVEVKSRATKAFKEAVEENPGKSVVTRTEWSDAERLAEALLKNKHVVSHLMGAKFEVPKIGMLNGLPFRCKADILVPGYGLFDIKTTTDLRAFPYSAKKYMYPMQMYIYTTIFGLPWENSKFIVIDKSSCDIGIYSVDESFINLGEHLLNRACQTYMDFFGPEATEEVHEYIIYDTLTS